ncbi:MAG: hypothetical protein SOX55_09525 [Dysosmobacter sp.]|nr:hypothetical protein [Dysosmobacter sp.]
MEFFLAANSGGGYHHLYSQLTEDRTLRDLLILKGGPGTEVPVFLRLAGRRLQAVGVRTEVFLSPEDPERWEGLALPELGCALVDGRPPRCLEPVYPGAVQRTVDLWRFADLTAAAAAREEIIRLTDRKRAAEVRAFHSLKAAGQLDLEARAAAEAVLDRERLARRTAGLLRRELRCRGSEAGRTDRRFLGTLTGRGFVVCRDTAEAICPKRLELEDSFGLGSSLLEALRSAAAERGWNTVACMAAEDPARMEHLLIPGLGLGVLTTADGEKRGRRVRLDAMLRPENRGRLRFCRRMAGQLRRDAADSLVEARLTGEALAVLYDPYTDWDGVAALAEVESARLLAMA